MLKTISVIHPSYQRPSLAATTAKNWLDKCKDLSNIEYIVCVATVEDMESYTLAFKELLKSKIVGIVYCDKEPSYVTQTNYGAKYATGDILLVSSDDFDCPQYWDALILNELANKRDFVAKAQDGIQSFLMTMPIMDRTFYNRFGYVVYPGYKHMYCDNDLAGVGHRLNKTITLDILFDHQHYSVGKGDRDTTNEKNESFMGVDRETFLERERNNFNLPV